MRKKQNKIYCFLDSIFYFGALVLFFLPANKVKSEINTSYNNRLGTKINGEIDGKCNIGLCTIDGGIKRGTNLFHKFDNFDTRGLIDGVKFINNETTNLIIGVTSNRGTFINKPINITSKSNLYWISPYGIKLSSGVNFQNASNVYFSTKPFLNFSNGSLNLFAADESKLEDFVSDPLRNLHNFNDYPLSISNSSISLSGVSLEIDSSLIFDNPKGEVSIDNSNLKVVDQQEKGGEITITAQFINLTGNNNILANGNNGGGIVQIGGSWQNNNPNIAESTTTFIGNNTVIDASANLYGDGGEIVIWSDVSNIKGKTTVDGSLIAKGGSYGGSGGKIETSGYSLELNPRYLDISSISNMPGEWLIDPYNIYITSETNQNNIEFDNYQFVFESSESSSTIFVDDLLDVIQTGNVNIITGLGNLEEGGNIFWDENADLDYSQSPYTLNLEASGFIDLNSNIYSGSGGLTLKAELGYIQAQQGVDLYLGGPLNIYTGDTRLDLDPSFPRFAATIIGPGDIIKNGPGSLIFSADQSLDIPWSGSVKHNEGKIHLEGGWINLVEKFNLNGGILSSLDPLPDLNNAPIDINLSETTFDENIEAASIIAVLSSSDVDDEDSHTYVLVDGDGDIDNDSFTINGSNLVISSSPDFETKESYSIRVQTTDRSGESYVKALTFIVNDLNETPTNINLSRSSFDENIEAASIIAVLSSSDVDDEDSHTYVLVDGDGDIDNDSFTINGSNLVISSSPDFETKESYSIRVQTTDRSGESYVEAFNLSVLDVDEPNNIIAFDNDIEIRNDRYQFSNIDSKLDFDLTNTDYLSSQVFPLIDPIIEIVFDEFIINPKIINEESVQANNKQNSDIPMILKSDKQQFNSLKVIKIPSEKAITSLIISDLNSSNKIIKSLDLRDLEFKYVKTPDQLQNKLFLAKSHFQSLDPLNIENNHYNPAILYLQFNSSKDTKINDEDDSFLDLTIIPSKGNVEGRRVEISKKIFTVYLKNLYKNISMNQFIDIKDPKSPSRKLYDLIIAPIEPILIRNNINSLIIAADRGLQAIPYAALSDGKMYFGEKYSFSLTPSLSLTNFNIAGFSSKDLLAFGATKFESLAPLPLVKQELQGIKTIGNKQIFLDKQFTPSKLISKGSDPSFKRIHLATHADFYMGGSQSSKIYTGTNPILISDLNKLRKRRKGNPLDLFVLSACRTAIGDENTELGFAGLALQTGARSAIGTLWYVDDVMTSVYFLQMYEYLNTGISKSEAMKLTRKAFIRKLIKLEGNSIIGAEGNILLKDLSRNNLITFKDGINKPFYWSGIELLGAPW